MALYLMIFGFSSLILSQNIKIECEKNFQKKYVLTKYTNKYIISIEHELVFVVFTIREVIMPLGIDALRYLIVNCELTKGGGRAPREWGFWGLSGT